MNYCFPSARSYYFYPSVGIQISLLFDLLATIEMGKVLDRYSLCCRSVYLFLNKTDGVERRFPPIIYRKDNEGVQ